MHPRYNEEKATQAAARLLKLAGGRMNHMKLIKLLYIADRNAILRWGRPITFDWYYSLPHGPVLSLTLNKVSEEPDPSSPSYWHRFISPSQEYQVRLVRTPPSDALSRAEETLLDEVHAEFGSMDQWQLRDYSHTLPEWQDPQGSRLPIDLRDILAAEGFDEERIGEVEEALSAEAFAESLGA
ncbi:SocA family protein [Candidatus Fermentibacteria bacterium]|nr:SocA family protein [Candidatus Fermentibacteria bacterium]